MRDHRDFLKTSGAGVPDEAGLGATTSAFEPPSPVPDSLPGAEHDAPDRCISCGAPGTVVLSYPFDPGYRHQTFLLCANCAEVAENHVCICGEPNNDLLHAVKHLEWVWADHVERVTT